MYFIVTGVDQVEVAQAAVASVTEVDEVPVDAAARRNEEVARQIPDLPRGHVLTSRLHNPRMAMLLRHPSEIFILKKKNNFFFFFNKLSII